MGLNDAKFPDDVHFGLKKLLAADAEAVGLFGNSLIILPSGEFDDLEIEVVGGTRYRAASRRNLARWLKERMEK